MKKVVKFLMIAFLVMPMVIVPFDVSADNDNKTLQDLINELNKLEKEAKDNKKNQELTQSRINEIRQNIINLDNRAREIEKTIVRLEEEIVDLNEEIESKDKEIKSLIKYLQVVRSNNAYLEYAFGAATMTDFIYRVSVVEQLTSHNERLIDSMNKSIKDKNQKTKDLAQEKINLQNQKVKLGQEQNKLGNRIDELVEYQKTLEEEIADAKKVIDEYRKMGCKPSQKLSDCVKIYLDSSFIRPLQKGRINSPYGWRIDPLNPGNSSFHGGIDIGGNTRGTNVYPAAAGTVAYVYEVPASKRNVEGSSCGGNHVIINHIIGGVRYATRYLHLSSVNPSLKTGMVVYRDTVIGGVGGNEYYERCSTGVHLHFEIAKGTYPTDFIFFREPHTVNPATLVNFPPVGGSFTGRY